MLIYIRISNGNKIEQQELIDSGISISLIRAISELKLRLKLKATSIRFLHIIEENEDVKFVGNIEISNAHKTFVIDLNFPLCPK